MGYELVGVEFVEHPGNAVLRVYIDHDNGITLDDCEQVSRQLSAMLDVEDPIPGNYSLEVSSPGMDRPLFKARDFERFAGNKVKLKLDGLWNGRRKFGGVLRGIRGDDVLVEDHQGEHAIPRARIRQARLVPEY